MPRVTVKASRKRAEGCSKAVSLVEKVSETTSSLLSHADRVLVVYENQAASLYYEGEAQQQAAAPTLRAGTLPRAS